MPDIIPGVGAGALLEAELLADGRSIRIGAIHRLDFDEAIVLTHDKWKFDAGGIPQFAFLLATAKDIGTTGDDDEILLLRVEGTASLAMESDLHAVREEALRTALSQTDNPSPAVVLDMDLDPFTKNRVSFTGLRCRVLGTFYEESQDGTQYLEFGADVDNFYATRTYRVLKPTGDGLATIASYLKPAPDEPVQQVRIGCVRYSSTRRRARAAKQDDAVVEINIHDLIGHKTGMFGMTRMGKSNTMKIAIARTFIVSEELRGEGKEPIGQLVFDPQGEYANPNTQDGTEIAAIGERHVIIYAFGATSAKPNLRPLGINFFDPAQLDAVKSMIAVTLAEGSADYVKAFVQADLRGDAIPGESAGESLQRRARAERGRLMLYGALAKADFPIPIKDATDPKYPWRAWVTMGKDVADAILNDIPSALIKAKTGSTVGIERDRLVDVCDWIVAKIDAGVTDSQIKGFDSLTSGDPFKSVLPIFTQSNGGRFVSGYTKLKPLRPFHAPSSTSDYRDEVYEELKKGKVVIVDLHLGPDKVTRQLSEDLAARLLEKQTEAFTSGKDAPRIQVILEEAHNLFGAEQYRDELDVWVRMAKEGSKLNVGMIYATQEVSGVAHQVLANTKNWVVAHLNNTKEVRHLSQFYDFEAFADAIIASEDKGYVRLKTMSSPFIVPVQIDRYGSDLVNEARASAGDPPLAPSQFDQAQSAT